MKWTNAWWGVLLAAFSIILLWFLQDSYPLIGHDYIYAFPRMLAGQWHAARQGPAPFRYDPHFCGGLPQYGNPHDFFYSLPQALSFFLGLWNAQVASIVIFVLVGYGGWHRVGKDLLNLTSPWAHTLALVVAANGHYMLHMLVGHVSFQALPLLGWLLWLLFGRDNNRGVLLQRTVAFAAITAYMLYAGGNFVLVQSLLLIACWLPFDLLLHGNSPARRAALCRRWCAFLALTVLLCASKLVAVYSMMRFFPRFTAFHELPGDTTTAWFMMKAFWGMPQFWTLFDQKLYVDRIYEYGTFISPLLLPGLATTGLVFLRRARSRHIALALCWAALITVLFGQLTRGHGLISDLLKHLPIFSSLRITTRFLYPFSLLLSCAGIWGLSHAFHTYLSGRLSRFAPGAAGALTLAFFVAAFIRLVHNPLTDRTLSYEVLLNNIHAHPEWLMASVTRVVTQHDKSVSDFDYIIGGQTGTRCYEPLLAGNTFLPVLREGALEQTWDGAFNMQNPACLQYPKQNGCSPGDRIALSERQNLLAFADGSKTTWKVSPLQRIADRITLMTFAGVAIMVLLSAIRRTLHG